MKVYSVLGAIPYEVDELSIMIDDLLAIFGSYEEAAEFITQQRPQRYYENYAIVMSELGQAVDVSTADWI